MHSSSFCTIHRSVRDGVDNKIRCIILFTNPRGIRETVDNAVSSFEAGEGKVASHRLRAREGEGEGRPIQAACHLGRTERRKGTREHHEHQRHHVDYRERENLGSWRRGGGRSTKGPRTIK